MVIKKIFNFIKSYKKSIFIGLGVSVLASGIALLSINWTNLNIIYAAGSSAVAPLMQSLSEAYRTEKGDQNTDVNVLNTGSGNGIEVIVNGTKNLGNVSRSPTIAEAGHPEIKSGTDIILTQLGQFSQQWQGRRLKTITLGWDAICVVYKPGDTSWSLDINDNNIGLIYQAISGIKSFTFDNLDKNRDPNSPTAPSNRIIPFARTGGAVKSGTTEAFIKDSHLKVPNDGVTKQALNILSNGSYSSNVRATKESNIETWKAISSQGGAIGSMTYLSGGFVLNNLVDIEKNGFKIATYNGYKIEYGNITEDYNWFRPLNTIVSLANMPDYLRMWLYWVLDYDMKDNVKKVFENAGVITLTPSSLASMAIPKTPPSTGWPDDTKEKDKFNFWVSDYELMTYKNEIFFGAK